MSPTELDRMIFKNSINCVIFLYNYKYMCLNLMQFIKNNKI